MAYSPLEMGLLTGKFQRKPDLLDSRLFLLRNQLRRKLERSRSLVTALEEIALTQGITTSQLALNGLIAFLRDNYHHPRSLQGAPY